MLRKNTKALIHTLINWQRAKRSVAIRLCHGTLKCVFKCMVGLSIVDGMYIKCRRPRQQLQIGFIRRRRRSESNYVSLCKCVHSICIHELDYDRTKSPKHVHTNTHAHTYCTYVDYNKQQTKPSQQCITAIESILHVFPFFFYLLLLLFIFLL